MPQIPKPKSIKWTAHSKAKMRHYRISEARTRRIIHSPKRIEEGIAPKTIAMMQSAGSEKYPYELWVMIQDAGSIRKIISVWRYPGVTKPRDKTVVDFLKNEYRRSMEKS